MAVHSCSQHFTYHNWNGNPGFVCQTFMPNQFYKNLHTIIERSSVHVSPVPLPFNQLFQKCPIKKTLHSSQHCFIGRQHDPTSCALTTASHKPMKSSTTLQPNINRGRSDPEMFNAQPR